MQEAAFPGRRLGDVMDRVEKLGHGFRSLRPEIGIGGDAAPSGAPSRQLSFAQRVEIPASDHGDAPVIDPHKACGGSTNAFVRSVWLMKGKRTANAYARGSSGQGQVFAAFGARVGRGAIFQEADVMILNPLTGQLVEIPLPKPRPKPTTAGR